MENHSYLTGYDEHNGCPVHGGRIRKIYRFGQYEDAEVVTFTDCGCAVCINMASLLCGPARGDEYTYHKRYGEAAGRAHLIKAQEAIANKPFA